GKTHNDPLPCEYHCTTTAAATRSPRAHSRISGSDASRSRAMGSGDDSAMAEGTEQVMSRGDFRGAQDRTSKPRERSIATSIGHPREARRPLRLIGQPDAVGDPVADDPDDAVAVADQGGSPPRVARDAAAAEEIVERHAEALHAQRREAIARH